MGTNLANEEDKRLVWASIKSVVDSDWFDILSHDPRISEKSFKEILKLMQGSCLERNPLFIQRLAALRISKSQEEAISDCLRRIYD